MKNWLLKYWIFIAIAAIAAAIVYINWDSWFGSGGTTQAPAPMPAATQAANILTVNPVNQAYTSTGQFNLNNYQTVSS